MKLLRIACLALLSAAAHAAVANFGIEILYAMKLSEGNSAVDACVGMESNIAFGMMHEAQVTASLNGYNVPEDFEVLSSSGELGPRRNLRSNRNLAKRICSLGNCKTYFCLIMCRRNRRRLVNVPADQNRRELQQQVCDEIQEEVQEYVEDLPFWVERAIARDPGMSDEEKAKARECCNTLADAL